MYLNNDLIIPNHSSYFQLFLLFSCISIKFDYLNYSQFFCIYSYLFLIIPNYFK